MVRYKYKTYACSSCSSVIVFTEYKSFPLSLHLQVSCIASGNDIITSVMPLNVPTTVDICSNLLTDGVRVSCSVAAFTSSNQIYLKGPDSDVESTVTHVDRKYQLHYLFFLILFFNIY